MKSPRQRRGFGETQTAPRRCSPAAPGAHSAPPLPGLPQTRRPPRSRGRRRPARTRRLLTDDGLLSGGRGSGQPEGHRCAQQQAKRVQQVFRARHGTDRLPPSFKGSVARLRGAGLRGREGVRRGGAPPRGLMGNVVPARTHGGFGAGTGAEGFRGAVVSPAAWLDLDGCARLFGMGWVGTGRSPLATVHPCDVDTGR